MFRFRINVVGISSDGDGRLLSTMKTWTSFDLSTSTIGANFLNQKLYVVQDTIHIGTKLRNRILNSSILLHIGNKTVSTINLKALLKTVAKEVHGLVKSDILPEDKQNYASLEKIMDDRVLNAMKTHVADSEGTIMYLTLCKLITSTFIGTNLKPIERIYKIWYAVYFLRCWRKWIKTNANYSLNENFISDNAYTCVEINAHNLIKIVIKLRSNEQEHLFLPQHFASQPCEHIFRTMRSMGTINYTKINFSLNELLHMVARVEIMNNTICTCKEIEFPRITKEMSSSIKHTFPTDHEILQAMKSALSSVLEKAAQFGIVLTANDIENTEISERKSSSTETSMEIYELDNENGSDSEDEEVLENTSEIASSSFLYFVDANGITLDAF